MTPDDPTAPDDLFAELLAAWDEAALSGSDPADSGAPEPPADLRPRLERGLACASLLRDALRPGADAPPECANGNGGPHLGRFRILRELGRGAYGIVFLAHDPRLRREVALKVPRPHGLATPELRERFLNEARAAAGLDHPNLVPVYEAGEAGPVCYIASAYCPGPNLAEWLRGRADPVPHREAAALLATLADAIQHAHARGVIHRDLKPSNILLAACGLAGETAKPQAAEPVPKITDFGLAKCLGGGDGAQTASSTVLGTPSYMAPEQAAGRPGQVGPAADVYALGAVLYEVLTGRAPFRAETPFETVRQVIEDDPVPPRRLRPDCPRDLETVCLKCLHKEPQRRYGSAAELAEDVRRFLDGTPIRARPTGRVERAAKWARRRPALAALLATAAAAAAALLLGSLWYGAVLQGERDRALAGEAEANRLSRLAEEQRAQLALRELTARRGLYAAHLNLAQQAWEAGHVGRVQELLEGQRPRPGESDLRGFEWHYLWRLSHGAYASWRPWPGLAAGGARRMLWLSPDAATAATSDGPVVRLWDVATSRSYALLRGHRAPVGLMTYGDGGNLFAAAADDGRVCVWDSRTGRLRATVQAPSAFPTAIALSYDGTVLAVSGTGRTALLWDLAAGKQRGEPLPLDDNAYGIDFSPDGRTLAVVTARGGHHVTLWDLATRTPRAVLKGHAAPITSMDFTADGRKFLTWSVRDTARLWDTAAGTCLLTVRPPPDGILAQATISPDGHTLASAAAYEYESLKAGRVQLWDTATAQPRAAWDVPGGAWALAFSPDSATVAVGENGGAIRLHAATDGRPRASLHGHTNRLRLVVFSPDGETLISVNQDMTAVKRWRTARRPQPALRRAHDGRVAAVAFARGGTPWASAGADGMVRLGEPVSGRETALFRAHPPKDVVLAFTPDGKTLATGGQDGTIKLWDVAARTVRLVLRGHRGRVCCVRFSPDGRLLASTGGKASDPNVTCPGEVILWDTATGKARRSWTDNPDTIWSSAFSPDGRLLAWAGQERLVVWDLQAERPRLDRKENTFFMDVAFSPDGTTLAAGTWQRQIRRWDLATGAALAPLSGHADSVLAVAYSPDGRTLASAGNDAAVKFWDAVTGHERFTLRGPTVGIRALAFRPDGRVLTAGLNDGSVAVWDVAEERPGEPRADEGWRRVEPPPVR